MGKYCLGGGGNEFQVIIGVHRLSSCTTRRDIERNAITESDPIKPENAMFLCLLI